MKIPGRHIIHFYDLSHHTLRLFIMQRRQSARYLNIIFPLKIADTIVKS